MHPKDRNRMANSVDPVKVAVWSESTLLGLFVQTGPISSVECPLQGTGGHRFDPGPQHTKVVKSGTSCSSLGTQGVDLGLVDPESG